MKLFSKKNKEKNKPELKEEEVAEEQAVLPAGSALPKGGDAHSYQMIFSPHITEKGTVMNEFPYPAKSSKAARGYKYIFKVGDSAHKLEIKKAIENLYKVKVSKVHVLYVQSKFRQVGKHQGRKSGFKKAIVTLKEGNRIDLAS